MLVTSWAFVAPEVLQSESIREAKSDAEPMACRRGSGNGLAWMLLPQNLEHLASKIRRGFTPAPRKCQGASSGLLDTSKSADAKAGAGSSNVDGHLGVGWRGGPRSWRCAQVRAALGRGAQVRAVAG
jgi:hypothetical protein